MNLELASRDIQDLRAQRESLQTFEIILGSIKSLENIARSHEQRVDDLEGR